MGNAPFLMQETAHIRGNGFRFQQSRCANLHVCSQDPLARSHLPGVDVMQSHTGEPPRHLSSHLLHIHSRGSSLQQGMQRFPYDRNGASKDNDSDQNRCCRVNVPARRRSGKERCHHYGKRGQSVLRQMEERASDVDVLCAMRAEEKNGGHVSKERHECRNQHDRAVHGRGMEESAHGLASDQGGDRNQRRSVDQGGDDFGALQTICVPRRGCVAGLTCARRSPGPTLRHPSNCAPRLPAAPGFRPTVLQ